MNWYKTSQENNQKDKNDDFWKDFFHKPGNKVIKKDPPTFKSVTLTLYRGFNVDPELLQRHSSGKLTLSPRKSEQGVLWFTCKEIPSYHNPREYVKGRGNYILTYPLVCKKHFQKIYYADGEVSEQTPEEFQSDPTSNSPFYMGYELPAGWFFSYKAEKFIICDHEIHISPNMLAPDDTFEVYENNELV